MRLPCPGADSQKAPRDPRDSKEYNITQILSIICHQSARFTGEECSASQPPRLGANAHGLAGEESPSRTGLRNREDYRMVVNFRRNVLCRRTPVVRTASVQPRLYSISLTLTFHSRDSFEAYRSGSQAEPEIGFGLQLQPRSGGDIRSGEPVPVECKGTTPKPPPEFTVKNPAHRILGAVDRENPSLHPSARASHVDLALSFPLTRPERHLERSCHVRLGPRRKHRDIPLFVLQRAGQLGLPA